MDKNSENNKNRSKMENKPQIEEEIDFMKVIKTPGRWFGLIYPYFIVIFLIGGVYFVRNMNTAYQNKVSPVIADSTNTFNDIKAPVKGSVSKGVDLKLVTQSSGQLADKGKTLFQTNCASCHGANGMGDGPAGAALNPKPRNFHSNQGWKNGRRISDMFTTLEKGIPGSGMPAFEYLPNEDKFALIMFIRSFANDFPPVTDAELSELDKTYNLTQGKQTPGQIPVNQAIRLVEEDAVPKVQNVYNAISYINNNPDENGAKLLNRVAADKVKALSYLSASKTWSGSLDEFIRTITSSVNVNGFRAEVVNLTGENGMNSIHT
ncbi:MAG: c-type cytochrome [Bacillota bacterium]